MSKRKNNTKKALLISLRKASYILKMSEPTLIEWLEELKIKTVPDENNFECIDYNKDFKKLTNNPAKKEKSQQDIKNYLSDCARANTTSTQADFEIKLVTYQGFVDLLESRHSELIKNYDLLNEETPINAALLIFTKIINMCNMFLHSIQAGYNSATILIRTIDEANTLAQYFVLLKANTSCQNDLSRWYLLEKSPSPSECRKKVSENLSKDLPFLRNRLQYLHAEVYQLKSKSVHHSFHDCSELLSLSIENDLITVTDVCYKSVNVFRKLEVCEYFESIINNVMQGFIICFKELLKEDELNELIRVTTELSFNDEN